MTHYEAHANTMRVHSEERGVLLRSGGYNEEREVTMRNDGSLSRSVFCMKIRASLTRQEVRFEYKNMITVRKHRSLGQGIRRPVTCYVGSRGHRDYFLGSFGEGVDWQRSHR